MANYTFGEPALEVEAQDKSIFQKIKDKFHKLTGKQEPTPETESYLTDWYAHVHRNLSDLELGLWARGGSIVPVLQHQRQLSILRAIDDPISLEIYLDQSENAAGRLVLDDGLTTKKDKLVVDYSYQQVGSTGVLRQSIQEQSFQTDKAIAFVRIYGVTRNPIDVKNQDGEPIEFSYDKDRATLVVKLLEEGMQITDFELLEFDYSPGSSPDRGVRLSTN